MLLGTMLRTGFSMPPTTLATVLSRLPMTLAIGFPVGNGTLFVAVLSPMPTPMLAPTPTHNGRLMSAGNAEVTKAVENMKVMVDCFILETKGRKIVTLANEPMMSEVFVSSECLPCSDAEDRNEDMWFLYRCLDMYQ
jgi:hypothetical protein